MEPLKQFPPYMQENLHEISLALSPPNLPNCTFHILYSIYTRSFLPWEKEEIQFLLYMVLNLSLFLSLRRLKLNNGGDNNHYFSSLLSAQLLCLDSRQILPEKTPIYPLFPHISLAMQRGLNQRRGDRPSSGQRRGEGWHKGC